ncbi:MAG: hypothetical protein V3G42_05525 [Oscillospiraceae bacterium]
MPDLEDMLGENPEVWTENEPRKTTPQLDPDSIEGLLGETPQEWTGDDHRRGAPVLEDGSIDDLLGDTPQVWSGNDKRGAPVVEEEVTLDDPTQTEWKKEQKQELQLDEDMESLLDDGAENYDEVAEFCEKLQFDDALKEKFVTLNPEMQQKVVEMRCGQLGIAPPIIPNALRPKITEEILPEAEEVELEEAPEPEEYVPKFKDEDLERIKEESKKPHKYVPPPVQMTEEQKKESVRMMNELREEREKEQAKKGLVQLIILTFVGIVGAFAFGAFASGAFGLGYKMEDELGGMMGAIKNYAPTIAILMGLSALPLAAPLPPLKGVTKFLYTLGFILSLFPGIPLFLQKEEGHGALNGLLLAASIVCCLAVVVALSVSDSINMYNKHGNS